MRKEYKNFQVRLPQNLDQAAEDIAAERGVSKADVVRAAVKMLCRAETSGGKIFIETPDGKKESIWLLF